MQRLITVNATQARQEFFELLNQVAKNGKEIIIKKKGLEGNVIMKKAELSNLTKKQRIEKNMRIVRETAGSLKPKIPYHPNEMELAAEIFVKEYKKKYGIK